MTLTQRRGIVQLSQATGLGRTGFIALAKGANIFKAALAATGIGAIVIAFGSLLAFLTRTQRGINIVSQATAGLSAGFNVIVDAASDVGEILFDAFNNPKQAVTDFGKALLDNVLNRFKAIIDLGKSVARVLKGAFTLQCGRQGNY